ncbi:MAG: CUAEP/CCAEP-tail radical SAM protein [Candidatus Poribacteria bacterium]|nr:CUAEP/CCAEP-tail radical SAM protein [Candidatus Poribacteria bacterium]
MKQPESVLLISCYELGHQPIGIASPLGFLQRAGYTPGVIDISVENLDTEKIARARFVGICVPMHTALRLGVHVAARARKINPNCHICFYGLYASLNAEYLLEHHADSVIGGEYEQPLFDLIDSLSAGKRVNIEGVIKRATNAAPPDISNPKPFLKRLSFAAPDRDALPPLEKYARLEQSGVARLAGYVEASRGCKHLCLHCPIPPVYEGRFFVVPRAVVLEDIRNQVAAGATHITFGDPDFLNGPKHALRIVQAMHEAFPDLTFDCTVKIEHILKHRPILPDLRACGCIFMVSAVESLNDTVLANLEKGHTCDDVFAAIDILREVGIALRPSLVPFTPWETLESYVYLLNAVESQGLIDNIDPVQYTIRLLIPPGSSLLSQPSIQPYLGSLDQEAFTYHWAHPNPKMDALAKAVSAVVERAAQIDEDAFVTFHRVRNLAYDALGKPQPSISAMPNFQTDRKRPPRLTEDWFC